MERLRQEHQIAAMICQPDQPAGRNRQLTPVDTKKWAIENNIPVWQPERLRQNVEIRRQIQDLQPDLSLVISYGKIIPEDILSMPRYHSWNVHASLLPELRGASPIESAILRGHQRTGLTIQKMGAEMDAGPLLATREVQIAEEWDAGDLRAALAALSPTLVAELLADPETAMQNAIEQDSSRVTFCSKIDKGDLWISWQLSAREIFNKTRALSPRLGGRTLFRSHLLKLWQVRPIYDNIPAEADASTRPGAIIYAKKAKLIVVTASGSLEIVKLQPENKKILSASEFINGFRPLVGEAFETEPEKDNI